MKGCRRYTLDGSRRCIRQLPLHLTIEKLNGKNYESGFKQSNSLLTERKVRVPYRRDSATTSDRCSRSRNGGRKTPLSPRA
ncbi:hypothetical protein AAG906_002519 [Vitis piasezkii]